MLDWVYHPCPTVGLPICPSVCLSVLEYLGNLTLVISEILQVGGQ